MNTLIFFIEKQKNMIINHVIVRHSTFYDTLSIISFFQKDELFIVPSNVSQFDSVGESCLSQKSVCNLMHKVNSCYDYTHKRRRAFSRIHGIIMGERSNF